MCKQRRCQPDPSQAGASCAGGNGACLDGACAYFSGFKSCRGGCIPTGDCCAGAECGRGAACDQGTCRCLAGFKRCGTGCIPDADCCIDADCPACKRCADGACVGDCEASQVCLANRSCAEGCNNGPDPCPSPCNCGTVVEGGMACRQLLTGCSYPTCTSTAQCPSGQVCTTNGCGSICAPLCGA